MNKWKDVQRINLTIINKILKISKNIFNNIYLFKKKNYLIKK